LLPDHKFCLQGKTKQKHKNQLQNAKLRLFFDGFTSLQLRFTSVNLSLTSLQLRFGLKKATSLIPGLALESRKPASLACRQFACPQAVFDYRVILLTVPP